jgi:hypothetical protein
MPASAANRTPPLARAFLALCDDGEPPAPSRTLPRVAAAIGAAAAIALAGPLSAAALSPSRAPEKPSGTLASKTALPHPAPHDDGGP